MSMAGLKTSAQIRENIEKQAKDPKTKERAAKADVIIAKDSAIFDSSKIQAPKIKFQGREKVPPKKKCRN